MIELKPSQLKQALITNILVDQPVCTWGPPGIGKSDIHRQVAAELGYRYLDIRAVLHDVTDFTGVPFRTEDGYTDFAPSNMWPKENDPPTLINLDELTRATPSVQSALFQLVLDRQVGNFRLAPQHRITTSNNRETDGGGVNRMVAALANRFEHLNLVVDAADWSKWAQSSGIQPVVIGYIGFRPEHLHQFDAKAHAFPTPRSWSFVSKVFGQNPDPQIEHALVAGAVGEAAAVEFRGFAKAYRDLAGLPDEVVKNPTTAPVPAGVATRFALAAALSRKADDTNLAPIVQYMNRMEQEYAVFAVQGAVTRDPKLAHTSTYVLWASAHNNVF